MIFLNKITEFKDFITYQALTIDESMNSRINTVATIFLKPLQIVLTYHNKDHLIRKFTVLGRQATEQPKESITNKWIVVASYIALIPATIIALNLRIANQFINRELCSKSSAAINFYRLQERHYSSFLRVFGGLEGIKTIPDIGRQMQIDSLDYNKIRKHFPIELFKGHNIVKGTTTLNHTFIAIRYTQSDDLEYTMDDGTKCKFENAKRIAVLFITNDCSGIIGNEFTADYAGKEFNQESDIRKFQNLVRFETSPDYENDSTNNPPARFRKDGKPIYTLGHKSA